MDSVKEDLSFKINDHRFDVIFVKGGTFLMGDDDSDYNTERPAHSVKLDDFYVGQYPVTQGLWKAVMGEENNPSFYVGDIRPVETISWEDCQEFLRKLNQEIQHSTHHFRLPTEAEWEYAARGGIHQDDFQYAGSNHLKEVGWYGHTSHIETKVVGQLCPNGLGLYDMSGNVFEWCQDQFDANYYDKCKREGTVKNPAGPVIHSGHVVRGGSWGADPEYCRVRHRDFYDLDYSHPTFGFRLIWSPVSNSEASIEPQENEERIKNRRDRIGGEMAEGRSRCSL